MMPMMEGMISLVYLVICLYNYLYAQNLNQSLNFRDYDQAI